MRHRFRIDILNPLAAAGGKPGWYLPVGAAWFALACVDACIGFACRLLPGGPALPWNPRKPILAVALGTAAALLPAWALAHLALPGLATQGCLVLGALVLVAACAETAWFGVADNLVIPFFLCVLIPLIPNPLSAAGSVSSPAWSSLAWYWALVPLWFGAIAYIGRMLTLGGSILGAVMALLLILANPWLFAFLGGFFALGNLATRFGFARKQALRIAEARGGKRGAAEVFGAMGLAAWMTPLVHLTQGTPEVFYALLVCVAPLIAKTMDTVSSEMGKAIAPPTRRAAAAAEAKAQSRWREPCAAWPRRLSWLWPSCPWAGAASPMSSSCWPSPCSRTCSNPIGANGPLPAAWIRDRIPMSS